MGLVQTALIPCIFSCLEIDEDQTPQDVARSAPQFGGKMLGCHLRVRRVALA